MEPPEVGIEPLPLVGRPPLDNVAAGSSSPHAIRSVGRDLPTGIAASALDPPVPLTGLNPRDGLDDAGVGHVPVLALRKVAEDGWVKWVEPSTTVGGVGTKGCFAEKATSDGRCGIGCRFVGARSSEDEAVGGDSSPVVDGRAVSVADDAIRVGVERVTVVRLQEVHDLIAELHDAHEPRAKARVLCGVRGSLHAPRVAHDGRLSSISESWLLRGAAAGSSPPTALRDLMGHLPADVVGSAPRLGTY